MMSVKDVPKNATFCKNYIKPSVKSALNNNIRIIGKLKLPFKIDNQMYSANMYVTDLNMDKIILGQDFIMQNRHLLISKLKEKDQITSFNNKNIITFELNKIDKYTSDEIVKTKYKSQFKDSIDKTEACNIIDHIIKTKTQVPIKEYNYRIPINYERMIDIEINKLEKNGIIKEEYSDWNSKLVPTQKKDGSLRLCIDYRPLNAMTIKEPYPIPLIDDILSRLKNAKYFTCLDATSGYHQILMDSNDTKKTAFT